MYLTHLSLTNFRNYARLDLELPQGAILLVGDNAQGKTSILEAIYYLAAFTSFHANHDRQLINFLAGREPLAVARITADFCRPERGEKNPRHRLEVRLIQESNGNGLLRLRKEALLDGIKHKVNEVVGAFNAVMFLPQTLQVIEGAPEERRRYLNLMLAQAQPRYAQALSQYNHALSQRNALLKLLNERGGDSAQLAEWDELLAAPGAEIIRQRIQAVQELERLATRVHSQLTHGEEVLRVAYDPAYDPLLPPARQFTLPLDAHLDRSGLEPEKIRQGFLESLLRLRSEEIGRGVTTIGPHRDDLRFLANGIDLGVYGSRGQTRTAVLATKIAEVAWLKERTGHWPVLLMDEVLAELDQRRRANLLARLLQCEQALLTTTDLGLFEADFASKARIWRVEAGRVIAQANAVTDEKDGL
jgi:DNA replication and repair protein RecF